MDREIKHNRPHVHTDGPELSGSEARQGTRRLFTTRILVISVILAAIVGIILWSVINTYTPREEAVITDDAPVDSAPPVVPPANNPN